jgi:CDP-paratose 2-epimerase
VSKTVLITGGAGFIGSNTAKSFKKLDWKVVIVDNLSRASSIFNLEWLEENNFIDYFHDIDIRDKIKIENLISDVKPQLIIHLAAQVAVTTSVEDPLTDFEINTIGTFNILEAIRKKSPDSFVINASTNKVYGNLSQFEIVEYSDRYELKNIQDVSEDTNLNFHSPYGCSKGAADQYVLDYVRTFNIRAVTLRQSCIYGSRQFGIEDQGWLAWFMIAQMTGKEITIYGNGKQVRDLLYIDDLTRLYQQLYENKDKVNGEEFNVGGGIHNSISVINALGKISKLTKYSNNYNFSTERVGDQKFYVSNNAKLKATINWEPSIEIDCGLDKLHKWLIDNVDNIKL